MLSHLFGRRPNRTTEATYAAIVAQARREPFYRGFGVADTVSGRFDLIVAHMAVFCGRFVGADAAATTAMQAVLDRFFQDMEDNLREMGVSDTGVPRKIKSMAAAWLGRIGAYAPALAAGDAAALADALGRNLYGDAAAPPLGVPALARYMIGARDALAATSIDSIIAGRAAWPDPAVYDPEAGETPAGRREEP